MNTTRPIHRFAQQRLRSLRMPRSIRRTCAVARLLVHGVGDGARSRTRIGAGRFTPIERVQRRCAVRVISGASVAAHFMLNVWRLADGTVPPRHADAPPLVRLVRPGPMLARRPAPHEHTTVVQRTMHERLLERLTVAAAPPAVRHAATVVRIEHRRDRKSVV